MDTKVWEEVSAKLNTLIVEKDCQLLEQAEMPECPKQINIQSFGHSYITVEDEESYQIVSDLVTQVSVGGKQFRGWSEPVPTALLKFKISSALARHVDPSMLFRTLPYKNGWPKNQACFMSCEDDPKDPSIREISFSATKALVNHIKQKPMVKVNLETSYVFHNGSLMKPNLSVLLSFPVQFHTLLFSYIYTLLMLAYIDNNIDF